MKTLEIKSFSDLAKSSWSTAVSEQSLDLRGLRTGLRDLDNILLGLQASDLVMVAGRPRHGKSALVSTMASAIAQEGYAVGVVTLETTAVRLFDRLVSHRSRFPVGHMRTGEREIYEWGKAIDAVSQLPIHVVDSHGIAAHDISAAARMMHAQYGIRVLFVDYIQLIEGTQRSGEVRQYIEISETVRALKSIAKELEITVVAVSQMSRSIENRNQPHAPALTDLLGSTSLENDADVVMFVDRPVLRLPPRPDEHHYQSDDAFVAWEKNRRELSGRATITIQKQRRGRVGVVDVVFNEECELFLNCAGRGY